MIIILIELHPKLEKPYLFFVSQKLKAAHKTPPNFICSFEKKIEVITSADKI